MYSDTTTNIDFLIKLPVYCKKNNRDEIVNCDKEKTQPTNCRKALLWVTRKATITINVLVLIKDAISKTL